VVIIRLTVLGFVAGFAATLVFHQVAWAALYVTGILPAGQPPWPLDPTPPFGVPSVISKSFWGGLWGAGLATVLPSGRGRAYWLRWIAAGTIALTVVANVVVPLIKGLGVQPLDARKLMVGCIVNGAWGFGTGLLLWLLRERRATRPIL